MAPLHDAPSSNAEIFITFCHSRLERESPLTTNMQLSEQNILNALKAVQDPDLHKNIVELNFVQNLKIEGTKVSFDLVLTTPACPIRDRFKDQCIAIVKGLGASEVEVTLTSTEGRVGDTPEQPKVSFLGEVSHIVGVASGKGVYGNGKPRYGVKLVRSPCWNSGCGHLRPEYGSYVWHRQGPSGF